MESAELIGYLAGAAWRGALGGGALWIALRVTGPAGGLRGLAALLWGGFVLALAFHPVPARFDCTAVPAMRLVPFGFVLDGLERLREGAGWRALAGDLTLVSSAANLGFFALWGALAHRWTGQGGGRWPAGVAGTALAGFLASAAIETLQGSAVLGLFPCPWRHVDVDDLILNTAGAALGGLAAGALGAMLARRRASG